jgi:hypothetical protein
VINLQFPFHIGMFARSVSCSAQPGRTAGRMAQSGHKAHVFQQVGFPQEVAEIDEMLLYDGQ